MKRSVFVLLICVLLLLVACGNQKPDGNAPSAANAEPTASGLKLRFSLKEEIEMFPYIAKVKIVSDPVPTIAQQYLQEAVLEENFQNMEDSRFTLLVRDNSLKNGSSYVLFMEKQASPPMPTDRKSTRKGISCSLIPLPTSPV